MGSLLGKIYSGLLHEVQLHKLAQMTQWPINICLSLKPWVPVSSKVLQSTISAKVIQVAGCGRLHCK